MELRPVAYRTLAARIRDAIRNGEYADGRQLPTEEQFAASYSVSRQTVRRAMQDLVSEGIIYRVAGRGTYPVADCARLIADRWQELVDLIEQVRNAAIVFGAYRNAGVEA